MSHKTPTKIGIIRLSRQNQFTYRATIFGISRPISRIRVVLFITARLGLWVNGFGVEIFVS